MTPPYVAYNFHFLSTFQNGWSSKHQLPGFQNGNRGLQCLNGQIFPKVVINTFMNHPFQKKSHPEIGETFLSIAILHPQNLTYIAKI